MMKKTVWTAFAVACSLLLLVGCASSRTPTGPSDEELVAQLMENMLEALRQQDIDAVAATYSDDFQSNQGTDKTQTVEFLKGVKDQGFLEGMEVDSTNMAIAVDGETATAEGVEVRGAFGVLAMSFKLEKRDGSWQVTYQAQE